MADIELVEIYALKTPSAIFEAKGVPMEGALEGMRVGKEGRRMIKINTDTRCVVFDDGLNMCVK
jgi:hypothetical protein